MSGKTPNTISKLESAFSAAKDGRPTITLVLTLDELTYLLAAARMQHYYTHQLQDLLKEVVRIKSKGSVNPDSLHLDLGDLTKKIQGNR